MVVCRCQVSASFARMSRGSSVKFDIFKNASGSFRLFCPLLSHVLCFGAVRRRQAGRAPTPLCLLQLAIASTEERKRPEVPRRVLSRKRYLRRSMVALPPPHRNFSLLPALKIAGTSRCSSPDPVPSGGPKPQISLSLSPPPPLSWSWLVCIVRRERQRMRLSFDFTCFYLSAIIVSGIVGWWIELVV